MGGMYKPQAKTSKESGGDKMTNMQEITVECFIERVENFIEAYNKLRKEKNENYLAYESRVFDLVAELQKDINDNKYYAEE